MLRNIFILLCFSLTIPSFAQLRYTETIFEKSDTLKNVEFAVADWLNSPIGLLSEYNIHYGDSKTEARPLLMDIFSPSGDTLSKRPAILFTFSGGFLMGSRHHDDMLAFCDSFAQRGYVTATMDYRIGMSAEVSSIFGIPYNVSVSEINATRSVYRAIQDSRAAIRFLKHNAENFGIDTTKIYMVGSSAGAFVALHNLYMDKSHEIPPLALTTPTLGNLDTVGIQGYGGQADAIVSMWGALQNPVLIENEQKPVLLIHGEKDSIVYFKKGMPLKSSIPDLDALDFNIPETYGGFCVDTALINLSIPHKTYFVPGKKHEFYGVDTGEWEENGPNEYWDTVHWKISDFLFEIFKPEANFEAFNIHRDISFTNASSSKHYALWDFGNGKFSNDINPVHTFENHGYQTITLTACNENMACDTLTKSIFLDPLSVNSSAKERINIFPNPVNYRLTIQGLSQQYSLVVFDIFGRVQLTNQQFKQHSLDVSALKSGIYILRIETENESFVRKFQKVN